MLACSDFNAEQAAMWAAVEQEVGQLAVSAAQTIPAVSQLAALLGDSFWGGRAQASTDGVVQQYFSWLRACGGGGRRRPLRQVVRPATRPMWPQARRATSAAVGAATMLL
jgi:hypothetical protein